MIDIDREIQRAIAKHGPNMRKADAAAFVGVSPSTWRNYQRTYDNMPIEHLPNKVRTADVVKWFYDENREYKRSRIPSVDGWGEATKRRT